MRSCSEPWGANGAAPRSDALHSPPRRVLWSCGRVPYGDRREPCGPGGQPVDNAHALPTACPHSRASRPQPPQDQQPSRFNKTPSHLTSPTPTHHHLPLIHNAFELAPPPPDAPHRSGSSLDWITLGSRSGLRPREAKCSGATRRARLRPPPTFSKSDPGVPGRGPDELGRNREGHHHLSPRRRGDPLAK